MSVGQPFQADSGIIPEKGAVTVVRHESVTYIEKLTMLRASVEL
jgi:hypothetical protein